MTKATAAEVAGGHAPSDTATPEAHNRGKNGTRDEQVSDAHDRGTSDDRQAENPEAGHEHEHGHEVYGAVEHELGVLLRRARAISAEMGREVHPDLDPEAYGLLVGIHDYGRARATELAGHFGLGKATISRQLKVLAQLGLIDREPDPVDGRAYVLVLTDEGRNRLETARIARRDRCHALLGTWPVDEVRLLAEMLARFNRLTEMGPAT